MSHGGARAWHGVVALVALAALVVQVALVISGESVLVTDGPVPSTGTRLVRFVSYFTVQANLLVVIISAGLVLRPDRDGWVWRVLRIDGVVGIAVTGIVHWFLLRPLLDLHGASYVTDKLLHVVVPLLAVAGWWAFGPRPRISRGLLLPAMAWPAAYMVFTLARGAATGWYPYPFVDVGLHGYPAVLLAGVGVIALLLGIAALLLVVERSLGPTPGDKPCAQ